jgi:hypothetical protein
MFTHVIFEVLAAKGKFRPDVTLIDTVNPSANRYNTIEENRHPPRTTPEFQFKRILRWSKVSTRRTTVMPCECPRIVQSKWDGSSRLKTCKDPDLDPAALGIEVPRK